MEREWEKEKEKILNSLLGSTQELEFPTEAEVCYPLFELYGSHSEYIKMGDN